MSDKKNEMAEIEPLSDDSLNSETLEDVAGGRGGSSDGCPSDGCPSDECPSDGCPKIEF